MKLKKISIASLFFLSGILLGQAVPESPKGIKANFSMRSIEAYQENSQNKLEEFYEYLSIYSSETNEELKKQIRENILAMADVGVRFRDFTESTQPEISLVEFLSKIENKSYRFEIKSRQISGELGLNEWVNSYVLVVTLNQTRSEFEVNQIIRFEPIEKKFGSKTKTVWEINLGDIQN